MPLPSDETTPAGDEDEACLWATRRHQALGTPSTWPDGRKRGAAICEPHAAASSSSACLRAAVVRGLGAEHPAELLDDRRRPRARSTRGERRLASERLLDPEVALGQRRDLRQVGDAEHLARLAERAQPLADGAGGLAADAGVDLVEHERRRLARAGHGHQREHHARQLAARGGLAQRRRRHARVRRQHELDALGPGGGPISSRGSSSTSNDAPSIASAASSARTALGQPRRRLRAAPRSARGQLRALGRAASSSRLGPLDRHLGLLQRVALGAAALGVREHRRDGAAVLALEPVVAARAAPRPPRSRPGSRLERPRGSGAARRRGPRPRSAGAASRSASASSSGSTAATAPRQPLGLREQPRRAGLAARRARSPRRRRPRRPRSAVELAQPLALGRQRLAVGLARVELLDLARSRSASRSRSRSRAARALAQLRQLGARARRTRAWAAADALRAARSGARPQKPSSSSSCADASVSRRCSCWPKNATSRAAELAQVGRRSPSGPGRRRRVRPSALTRRASTISSASSPMRSRRSASSGSSSSPARQLEDALDVGLARARAHDPGRGLPPSSRSSACASTVLPAPVSPVMAFRPGAEPQLGPLDQQQVLDSQLAGARRRCTSAPGRNARVVTACSSQRARRPNFSRRRS